MFSRFFSARRLKSVAQDPRVATLDDIELLMRAHAVREHLVWEVLDRVRSAGLSPREVWDWTMAHDGTELAHMLASGVEHDVVRHHVAEGTMLTRELVAV